MFDLATKTSVNEAVSSNPNQTATLSLRYLIVGVIDRRNVEQMFATIEAEGGAVSYHKSKGFLATEYHNLTIKSKAVTLKAVISYLERLAE